MLDGVAARLLDEAVHHAEAQTAALPHVLRGEEGLEGVGRDLGRHAVAAVANRQPHVLPGLELGLRRGVVLADLDVRGLDHELAAPGHGVAGVDREIQNGVLQLPRVDATQPEPDPAHDLDLDGFTQRAA
jgi:hypothetical protein